MFSTDTEKQAHSLIVAACETSQAGDYLARELVTDQSIENLEAFSDRLAVVAERMKLFGDQKVKKKKTKKKAKKRA